MWNEESTPHDAKVCNYFVNSWIQLGYEVLVIHYRPTFPSLYVTIAKKIPYLANLLCGDQCYVDEIKDEFNYNYGTAKVYSIPIFKYIPHRKYSRKQINIQTRHLIDLLNQNNFIPDAIISHFINPSVEIIDRLSVLYPSVKKCLIIHEDSKTIARILGSNGNLLLNRFDSIGYRSLMIKEEILHNYKLKNHSFICYSGISSTFADIPYKERKWPNGQLSRFLFVGRLSYYKYPDVIPEALVKAYSNYEFTLSYVGKKETAYNKTVTNCLKHNLQENVRFLGQISRDETLKWYDESECFIMVSDKEVFGLVYLEAMARGCIVIAGDNGGMVGIINHGINGFLCKPGDPDALAGIIKQVNSMTEKQKSIMSNMARETAMKFTNDIVAINYLNNVFNYS